ncbi:MAG: hypothetical protein ABI857_08275, partial [Acidobacteriota bacterium]
MNEKKLPSFSKSTIVLLGIVVVGLSLFYLGTDALSPGFAVLLLISGVIAPRMGIVIPRSKVVISFSDSVVFLSFLMYGPAAAVLMSAVETFANCYYTKVSGKITFKPYMIAVNTFSAALGTGAACLLWEVCNRVTDLSTFSGNTRTLIATLCILALGQFATSTAVAALILPVGQNLTFWETWKRDCLAGSTSHFVGAGTAGMIYRIIGYGDAFTAGVALIVFGIVYLTYRQSIQQI